jgi:hypothetical protein
MTAILKYLICRTSGWAIAEEAAKVTLASGQAATCHMTPYPSGIQPHRPGHGRRLNLNDVIRHRRVRAYLRLRCVTPTIIPGTLQRQSQTTRMYGEDIGFCCSALTEPRR